MRGASLVCEAVADIDAVETEEWLEALDAVVEQRRTRARPRSGRASSRARALQGRSDRVRRADAVCEHDPLRRSSPPSPATANSNGASREHRPLERDGDGAQGQQETPTSAGTSPRSQALRRGSTRSASITSFRAPSDDHGGDLVYIQGHSSPGIYARAFLEGRFSEEELDGFRQEVSKEGGLSSTRTRGSCPTSGNSRRSRWAWGRSWPSTRRARPLPRRSRPRQDQGPEDLGLPRRRRDRRAGVARRDRAGGPREALEPHFVVNCNLQRLDGPVHGNGKIIQELETIFRGAGWNVIKVVWGDRWDPLLAEDTDGLLVRRMEEAVDGETRPTRLATARTCAEVLRRLRRARRPRQGHDRRGDLGPQPRRP